MEAPAGGGPVMCPDCQMWPLPPAREDADSALDAAATRDEIARAHLLAPTQLAPWDYYLICDHQDIVARWENDGHGWMLHRRDGFSRARHLAEQIPLYGEFVLIDIGIRKQGEATRMSGVMAYQLQRDFALLELVKSDTAILRTIIGPTVLNERQKDLVRDFVKSRYLKHVWGVLDELLEQT